MTEVRKISNKVFPEGKEPTSESMKTLVMELSNFSKNINTNELMVFFLRDPKSKDSYIKYTCNLNCSLAIKSINSIHDSLNESKGEEEVIK